MDIVLVYFKSDGQRKDFPLKTGRTLFGRSETCDYRLPVQQVSREHCELIYEDDKAILRDLNSSNGTYVNGKRIAETELAAGDQIIVGPAAFIVQIDGEPADPQPVEIPPEDAAEKQQADAEELAGALLVDDEEEEDETSKAAPLDDGDDFDLDLDDEDDEGNADEAGNDLSDALEALATNDDEDDPFADFEDDDDLK